MRITFRDSEDKTKSKIFLNGSYLGSVKLDIWTQKWAMSPSFNLPHGFFSIKKNKFDSSYEAGKEMVNLYNYLFPRFEEDETQEFGFSLDDIVSFLKTRE